MDKTFRVMKPQRTSWDELRLKQMEQRAAYRSMPPSRVPRGRKRIKPLPA